MAINKKLIHFKKFSDFNSKKLSANEENTKYTVGVGGSVTTGAPDILYQSICWIKDTKQQWTHGELYDCDMGDVKPYVAFFTLDEIQQLADIGESRQCDQEDYEGILDAVESGRPILIPNGYAANGYATVVNKSIDDCIYLTVVGDAAGGAPRFYDVNVYQGEVVAQEITYQNELVSGTTIKTVNGQSLLGSGDISTYNAEDFPYTLAVELSEIVESAENGTTFEYYESDYEELRTAIDQGRMVLVENLYDGSGKAAVVNQIASDMVYLTLVANLGGGATPRFYAVEIERGVGSAREITYQQALVSGQNIKTVNGESLLGSGNVNVTPYIAPFVLSDVYCVLEDDETRSLSEQDYISLQNAVNSNVPIVIPNDIAASGYAYVVDKLMDDVLYLTIVDGYTNSNNKLRFIEVHVEFFGNEWRIFAYESTYQPNLVSGTNIKTINGSSILGSGNLEIHDEPYLLPFTFEDVQEHIQSGAEYMTTDQELYDELRVAVENNQSIVLAYGYDQLDADGYMCATSKISTDWIYLYFINSEGAYDDGYNIAIAPEGEAYVTKRIPYSEANIKTINGQSLFGSGDITISSGPSFGGSGAYSEIQHGTSDTTFDLTPNTFHVWDEVASLTLAFDVQTIGIANEFLFQFTSGSTATTLSLPDDIKWANDNAPTIEPNKIYQISILNNLASVLEFNNAVDVVLIDFKINGTAYIAEENMTWEEWVNSEYNAANCTILDSYVYKDGAKIGINYVAIHKNDTIINNQTYMLIASGGGGAD